MRESQSSTAGEVEGGGQELDQEFDLLDLGLAVGATWDVLTPVYRIARGVIEGPHHDYGIYGGGYTGREIDMLLSSQGVRHFGMWGIGMTDDYTICVKVPLDHCQKAERVFKQYGIAIYNPVDPAKLGAHRVNQLQKKNGSKKANPPRLTSGQIAKRQRTRYQRARNRQRRQARTWRDFK